MLFFFMFDLFIFLYTQLFNRFPDRYNPTYLVTQVYDGDSFVVDNLFHVRLTNIDAPDQNECLYQESRDFLTNLILNKRVKITSDTPSPDGRVLSQVYLEDKYINLEMIKSSLAIYTSGSYPDYEILKQVNADNKSKKIGIFQEKCLQTVNPINPKCNIKGNYKEKHYIYTVPGCRSYNTTEMRPKKNSSEKSDRWFCTEAEAIKAGFIKAKNCQ